MTDGCCGASEPDRSHRTCPESNTPGIDVDWLTVAALSHVEVPPHQRFWLCRDRDCAVVYFGENGCQLRVADLTVEPGFKGDSCDAMVCYCFLYRRSDLERKIVTGDEAHIPARIATEIKAGNCACEVRNPTGKCCLGDVQRVTRELIS